MTNVIQYSKTEYALAYRQAFVMSMLTMFLWVCGKKLYSPIWCKIMVGKFHANVNMREWGGTPGETILTRWWYVHGGLWSQSLMHLLQAPQDLAWVCGWHFCCPQGKTHPQFLTHLNSHNPNIQFTMETPNQQGSFPLLDTLGLVGTHGSLFPTFYRKPTHTDWYLHWDIHHSITTKYSVFNPHIHRTQTVCFKLTVTGREQQHIWTAFSMCNYPDWVFYRLQLNWTIISVPAPQQQP